jgi:hypothetical protein
VRKSLFAVAVCITFVALPSTLWATPIGGLEVGSGGFITVSQIFQNVPTGVGQTLAGYGKVDSINTTPVSSLCSGCELTYVFDSYLVTSISSAEIRFTGGSFRFYLGFGADNDFTTANAGGSFGDLAEAANGTLFLTLLGHPVDAAGNTLISSGVGFGTSSPTGTTTGLLDVNTGASGIGNTAFNTNSIAALFGGPADFQIGYSFSALNPVYPAECPGGNACLRGSATLNDLVTAPAVPEPASLTLLGLGLLMAHRRLKR